MNVIFQRVAKWILGGEDSRVLTSEMEEMYERRRERDGPEAADRWLSREQRRGVGKLLASRVRERAEPNPSRRGSMANVFRGIRSSLRGLTRAPVFALSIIGTLAIGIGGTTSVFSIVHAVLLSPLPYPESGNLVEISNHARGHSWVFSVADYLALEEQQTTFEGVAAMDWSRTTYSTASSSDRILVHSATPGLFSLLDIQPAYGRSFRTDEGEPGAPLSALVTWDFWKQELGGDPEALGSTIRLDGKEIPIVGILPLQVGPVLEDAKVILPLQLEPPPRKGPFFLVVMGRLKEGVDPATASAELRTINERIFPVWQDSWTDQETTWAMANLKDSVVGEVGTSLLVVLGAAVFVFLMVCANAASLLLARLLDRRRELAVRTALGASRGQLVGHLLTESGTLASLGAVAALALALGGIHLITTVGSSFIPRTAEVGLTGPVLLFFVLASVGSLVLFGVLPALKGPPAEVAPDLKEGGSRSSATTWTQRTRNALVATQFAVSVPVLVGGGLLVASLLSLARVDPGFDADRLLALDIALPEDEAQTDAELQVFWETTLQEIRGLPGVAQVGVGQGRPPSDIPFTNNFDLEDHPVAPGETQPSVPWVFASTAYLEVLGTHLIAGRLFDPSLDQTNNAVLVDEAWARRFFNDADNAIGRRFVSGGCTGPSCPRATVIGVVEEVRYTGLEDASPGIIFLDSDSYPTGNPTMVVRAESGVAPSSLATMVRDVVWRGDDEAAISRVATGDELLSRTLRVPRYLAILVGAIGGLSLLLAILGIYGVMDYFVRQNRRDMGIRLALGGDPGHVVSLVMRQGMTLVAIGVVAGLVGALALTRYMGSLLFGVGPTDPRVVGSAVLAISMTGILACWNPARRAARIPPREVLAEE